MLKLYCQKILYVLVLIVTLSIVTIDTSVFWASGTCPFSNINWTTTMVCHVNSTGWIYTQVSFLKNWSYPFDTSWNTFNPINMGVFTHETSTGTNIWFRVSAGMNMSWSIYWNDGFTPWATGATGPIWATGATGSQWAQGIQGIPWMDGYNNFELAQIQGFTGDEVQYLASLVWPMWATGSTGSLLLDLSQSGTIALQNNLTLWSDVPDNFYDSGSYLVFWEYKKWVFYIQQSTFYFLLISLLVFFLVTYWLVRFFSKILFSNR